MYRDYMRGRPGSAYSGTQKDKKDNGDSRGFRDNKEGIPMQEYRVQSLEDAYRDDTLRSMGYT